LKGAPKFLKKRGGGLGGKKAHQDGGNVKKGGEAIRFARNAKREKKLWGKVAGHGSQKTVAKKKRGAVCPGPERRGGRRTQHHIVNKGKWVFPILLVGKKARQERGALFVCWIKKKSVLIKKKFRVE